MFNILIVYASVGGNTSLVCSTIKNCLQTEIPNVNITILRAEQFKNTNILKDQNLIILASPTYGQGDLENQMKIFLKKIQPINLSNQKFAVVGLGDTKYYPEFLSESASLLESWIKEKHGVLFVPSLRIGMPPLKYLEKLIPRWCQKIIEQIAIL